MTNCRRRRRVRPSVCKTQNVEAELKANIDRVLPLSQAAAAHRLQEESTMGRTGAVSGKIVLTHQTAG